jgi:diguanylate cyclase (GGDEF)-like protein/PAS domain S-box-containing protein
MSAPGTLLVVDDNEDNRDALSRRLMQRGYAVQVAAGGEEALALIASQVFDLILLDVEMPGMSGLEALKRLRATYSQTQLPVIFVTARAQAPDVIQGLQCGANDYVTKPVDMPVAIARIETQLSHRRAVDSLRESEERYALAVRGANDGLWDWNLVTNEAYFSPRWKAMLGHPDGEIGSSAEEWLSRVHHDDASRVRAALAQHLADGSDHFDDEHRVLHRGGTYRWVHCRAAAVRNAQGTATRIAGSFTDITEGKLVDALTGLPNRLLFLDLLERAILRAKRRGSRAFAMLILGLDRFSAVTDSLGPLNADHLLVAVARRLQASLRATDTVTRAEVTLARLGGDEFNVLLDDIADASDAVRVAERLRLALADPFVVDGNSVFASATVGIAVSTTGYEHADEVLRDAAIALHRAKATGGGSCEIFDPAMRAHAVARLQLETELRQAIEDRAFVMHYQPIISLRSGRITALEALIRWRHPVKGLVGPNDFIPIAEQTGMIRFIGRLAIETACRQMAEWRAQFGSAAPELMCVNVSSLQFADPAFLTDLEAILRDTSLPPSSLKLEITESAFINDLPAAQSVLSRAQAAGVRWSLDDFGTGYSSLSQLHRLQVDTLKVDQSFVGRMQLDPHGPKMVRAIVDLAHNLGRDVVAEGVETAEQLALVKSAGCEHAQGFHFSRPVASDETARLLLVQPWQRAAAVQT